MSRHNVLLIDDEAEVLASLKRALRYEGYRVLAATSGPQALELIERTPVSLVVCDLAMPGMDGHRLLAVIKERHPEVVRVALTGVPGQGVAVRAINEGEIYRFLTKPWSDEDLRATILDALERHEMEREGRALSGRSGLLRGGDQGRAPQEASNHNVLLVDDEGLVLNSLKRALRGEGYHVYTAANGWETMGLLERLPVAVVVCDLAMPGMDGHRLLAMIKERHPEVVRVVLTGLADQAAAARAINEGEVYRFLTKPWSDDELRDCILDALERFEEARTGAFA